MSAIVDSNLTTLLTALILFQFGTGPVRGFAVTLSVGIVASFFSAVYVTRTFFLLYLAGRSPPSPSASDDDRIRGIDAVFPERGLQVHRGRRPAYMVSAS
jgi:hypothetical protein